MISWGFASAGGDCSLVQSKLKARLVHLVVPLVRAFFRLEECPDGRVKHLTS